MKKQWHEKSLKEIFSGNKKKKSHNPFKMWGSYLGVGIYLLLLFVPVIYTSISPTIYYEGDFMVTEYQSFLEFPTGLFYTPKNTFPFPSGGMFMVFGLNIIFYFLIGWGIHSLIRKVRK